MQRRADRELADHPYRLELVGGLNALTWPAICASCGADTAERLTVRKVFVRPRRISRTTRGYRRYLISGAQIPYCGACITRHRSLMPSRSLLSDAWRMLWPLLIPMTGSLWFLIFTLRIGLATPSTDAYWKYAWMLPALFGVIVLWCVVVAWHSSRALRVEKQSDITRACDFSDNVSWFWQGERRIYALRNERFAQAFAAANTARAWNPADDRRSSRTMAVGFVVMGVVGAIVWAVVVLGPQ